MGLALSTFSQGHEPLHVEFYRQHLSFRKFRFHLKELSSKVKRKLLDILENKMRHDGFCRILYNYSETIDTVNQSFPSTDYKKILNQIPPKEQSIHQCANNIIRKTKLPVVGERPWADELLPYTGDVRPWGVQRLSITHEVSGKPRMR